MRIETGVVVADFMVRPGGLEAMEAQLRRLHADVSAIGDHLAKVNTDGFTGPLLGMVRGRADAVIEQVRGDIRQAVSLTAGSSEAVGAIRKHYEATDNAEATRQDGILPDASQRKPPFYSPNGAYGSYSDVAAPVGRLTEPPGYDEEMAWKATLKEDIGSVTGAARELARVAFGSDPFEPISNGMSGDWREVRRISDRFNNAGLAFDDAAKNLGTCVWDSRQDWNGNAAQAARGYLALLDDGMRGEYEKCVHLAGKFKSLAEGSFQLFKSITDLVSKTADAFIEAAAAGVVAGGTAAVPYLDIATGGFALYKVARAVLYAKELYDKYNELKTLVETIQAGLDLLHGSNLVLPFPVANLPAAPYTSPF